MWLWAKTLLPIVPRWHNHPHIQPNNKGFQPGHINHNRVLEGTQPPVFFWWKIPAGEFVWTWATSGTPIARQLWRYPLYLWTKPTMISAEKYHVVSDKYPSISRWIIAPFQNLRDPCSTIISSWIYLYNLIYISPMTNAMHISHLQMLWPQVFYSIKANARHTSAGRLVDLVSWC